MTIVEDRRDLRPVGSGRDDVFVRAVRRALGHLRNPRQLTDSLLFSVPGLGSPQAVAVFLRGEIAVLAGSASPVDREAAQILSLYYLGRSGGHDVTAHRVHLSRATYFRRLDHGVRHLAEAVQMLGPADSGLDLISADDVA